ncbi:protein kinase superfamily protein [Abortiporus biennis]
MSSESSEQPEFRGTIVSRSSETEPQERYRPGGYHRVSIGEVFNQRYRAIEKIGWGLYSTVWAVEDMLTQTRVAMKVLVSELTSDTTGWDERGIMVTLRSRNPEAPGYRHICRLLDDFIVVGPNGSHICLITELMGPTVSDIIKYWPDLLPLSLVKRISKHVLLALQYMHDTCDMAHTDIKGDNIFMTGVRTTPTYPSLLKISEDVVMSTTFKLGDFGSTNTMSNRYAAQIQPIALRAPEVLIEAGWDVKVDIFNFGCLVYEFITDDRLFNPGDGNEESGLDMPQTHLAQMVCLLGDFPQYLLTKGAYTDRYFDAEGNLLKGSGKYSAKLEELLPDEEMEYFPPGELSLTADFLKKALTIDPIKRWSASQLLGHPWLQGIH